MQEGGRSLWASQAMWRMGFKGALRASGWGLGDAELHIRATSRFPGTPHMLPMPPVPQAGLAPVRTDQMLGEALHPEGYIPDLNSATLTSCVVLANYLSEPQFPLYVKGTPLTLQHCKNDMKLCL